MTTESIIKALDHEISQLREVRRLLSGDGRSTPSRKTSKSQTNSRPKRTMSKEARERIAAAQRKRWAAQRKAKA
jgi:hypothetical protein